MITEFNNLPEDARIWIFPSSRKFYEAELTTLKEKLEIFLSNWLTDNEKTEVAFTIEYNRFIIIGVNVSNIQLTFETHESLGNFIQFLEKEFEVVLFDRINVCFKQGEFVQYKEMKDFKKLIKSKSVSEKTLVFNNLIATKKELDENWEIPLSESHLSHLIKSS